VFLAAPLALIGLILLSFSSRAALGLLIAAGAGIGLGVLALRSPENRRLPGLVSLCGFVLASHLAGLQAWIKALRGENNAIWEPTRRTT
jgi:hypothetical protein